MTKKIKLLVDEKRDGGWVRCWKERRQWIVQVWKGNAKFVEGKPCGEPDGDWEMPGVFPMEAAIAQAVLQTD